MAEINDKKLQNVINYIASLFFYLCVFSTLLVCYHYYITRATNRTLHTSGNVTVRAAKRRVGVIPRVSGILHFIYECKTYTQKCLLMHHYATIQIQYTIACKSPLTKGINCSQSACLRWRSIDKYNQGKCWISRTS